MNIQIYLLKIMQIISLIIDIFASTPINQINANFIMATFVFSL
jgi:hypothetical protein